MSEAAAPVRAIDLGPSPRLLGPRTAVRREGPVRMPGRRSGMKVCQLCAVDFTLRHFLLPLIDGMAAEGWNVTAVCTDGPHVPEMRGLGYNIQTVSIARSLSPWQHGPALVALTRLFRRERFDVLHAHTPVAALLGRAAARLAGIPLNIYTAHGFYFHDEMPSWKRRAFVGMEKVGGWMTDLLFTQSTEDARAAVSEGIVAPEQVTAIGNGVDVARFDPARVGRQRELRRSLGVPDTAFLIGMIGRSVAEKGIGEFLEAARSVAERYPQATFLQIGDRLRSDHAGSVEAATAAARRALGDRLIVTGMRSDVPELLAAMDLFCLPSHREGMPRTIIEAMMMEKPVVATNIRGCREEVVDGATGLLVPSRDAGALARAMARCIEDPAWAARMGAAGRRRALELYDERGVVALQVELIRKLSRSRGLPA